MGRWRAATGWGSEEFVGRLAGSAVLLLLLLAGRSTAARAAAPVRFRLHVLNAESEFGACAVMDVNRDGRPDIVSGGFWYEGPAWRRRFLREVERIGNRYDDYSNLPLDVNGDGWVDLVSCNYRSKSLYWVEHPGASLRGWTRHVIDTPGAMETGRLADVDGDGRWDVLPNGVRFAAWWRLERGPDGQPRWIRHDLPEQAAGHGVGCGDVNGDGRPDIVGPRGWLEGVDALGGRWTWRGEFDLDGGASIPILVHDVDGDGDADLIWGRGHRTGLYWLEQSRDEAGRRRWTRHAIDTSWSQPHSLLLADVDGDGADELIAGKRYLGHDGKDPGEYDPLGIYWYDFDPTARVWRRGAVSEGGRAGFGLDPKAADVDGDGDVDVVSCGRSGLYLLENLRIAPPDAGRAAARSFSPAPLFDDHAKLLAYHDESGEARPVTTPAEWFRRRAEIRAGMQRVMGPLPDSSRRVPLDIRVLEARRGDGYVLRKITYQTEPGDRAPAWLLTPERLSGKAPAMLCLHPTSRWAKDEVAGLDGRPSRQYGRELAQRGYVCLVPDYPSFGEYAYDFDAPGEPYVSGSMKAVWNNIRALDVLDSLPEVDHDRIGCIGHSLGGHNALFTAAFDLRIRAIVVSCGFTAFHRYYDGDLTGWTSARYMPLIAARYDKDPDRVPFDFHEVIAAMAPRPLFVNAPLHDGNFDIRGVRQVLAAAGEVYYLLGAQDRLHAVHPDCAHDFPDQVRQAAYAWLDQQLNRER